jgi:hypothetical protein
MKSFIQLFTDARAVSTPLVDIRTFDPASTIQAVTKSLDNPKLHSSGTAPGADKTPLASWDAIHGLRGLNEVGSTAVAAMCQKADGGIEPAATVDLAIALGVLEYAAEDLVVFIHNPQLIWGDGKIVIQAFWNLRDGYKANGNMLVMLTGPGDQLPVELQQDTLILDEPLPTRDELAQIVKDTFAYASQNPEYKACKGGATDAVVKAATDALIGIPAFPAEQATAMCLDKKAGKLDIKLLWERKKTIVSQNRGLTYHNGNETLKDMYGVEQFKRFGLKLMNGKQAPTLILRADEIEKQFAGNQSDSSGVKGDMLGEFLTWVEDNKIICSLLLGVPGSSKSWATYCIGGEFGKPVINYSISAMQDSLVGNSGKFMRNANRTIEAISDGKVWLIATANSLNGLPPELISRFQVGGIFFFDAPEEDERNGIMNLKIKKYGLDPNQKVPNMEGWTGRDIENCARKADMLECSLEEAGQYVVPLMTSHREQMQALRQSAAGRFLSASKPGVYEYTELSEAATHHKPTVTVEPGRKMR